MRKETVIIKKREGWLDGITNSMDMSLKQTLGDGEGQGRLACCSPWGHKKSDTTERLNNNKLKKRKWSCHYSLWEGSGRADLEKQGVKG